MAKTVDPTNEPRFSAAEVATLITEVLEDRLLSTAEAAEELGISVEQVESWTAEGILRCQEIDGTRVYRLRSLYTSIAVWRNGQKLAQVQAERAQAHKGNGQAKRPKKKARSRAKRFNT